MENENIELYEEEVSVLTLTDENGEVLLQKLICVLASLLPLQSGHSRVL